MELEVRSSHSWPAFLCYLRCWVKADSTSWRLYLFRGGRVVRVEVGEKTAHHRTLSGVLLASRIIKFLHPLEQSLPVYFARSNLYTNSCMDKPPLLPTSSGLYSSVLSERPSLPISNNPTNLPSPILLTHLIYFHSISHHLLWQVINICLLSVSSPPECKLHESRHFVLFPAESPGFRSSPLHIRCSIISFE